MKEETERFWDRLTLLQKLIIINDFELVRFGLTNSYCVSIRRYRTTPKWCYRWFFHQNRDDDTVELTLGFCDEKFHKLIFWNDLGFRVFKINKISEKNKETLGQIFNMVEENYAVFSPNKNRYILQDVQRQIKAINPTYLDIFDQEILELI